MSAQYNDQNDLKPGKLAFVVLRFRFYC